MIDLLVFTLLTAACVLLVRRVRLLGFAALRPPTGLFASMAARIAGPEETEAHPPPLRPTPPIAAPPVTADEEAPGWATAPPSREPEAVAEGAVAPPYPLSRRLAVSWIAAAGLSTAAILFQHQLWLNQDNLRPFWALLATSTAAALALWIGARWPQSLPSSGGAGPPGANRVGMWLARRAPAIFAPGPRRSAVTGVQLLVAAAVGAAASIGLFWTERHGGIAWVLYVAACVLFLVGVWLLTRATVEGLVGSWQRSDSIAIGIALLSAFVARTWSLSDVPRGVWFDESFHAISIAMRVMQDPTYRPIWLPGIAPEAAAYWFLTIPFLALWPHDPMAIRLPAAISGTLAVGAVYLLARGLFDRRVAIAAAGLSVGLVWQLNFSRIAFNAMSSVFLDTFAAALFVAGLKRRNTFAFAAAGLSLGVGFNFYYTTRVAIAVLAVVAAHRILFMRLAFFRDYWRGIALFLVGIVLGASPILEYGVQHPDEFNQRMGQVTVMTEIRQANSWQPLVNNVRAHLLMFDVRGDPNGRHNWTGRPMLSPVIGAMAVLGLILALSQIARWTYVLPLAWFVLMLAGGVFSVTWEAPQGLRTIDEVTGVALFAGIGMGALWGTLQALLGGALRTVPVGAIPGARVGGGLRLRLAGVVSGILAIALVSGTSATEISRYFTVQQRDNRTWGEFLTPQAEAARRINRVPTDWKVLVDPFFAGDPSVQFLLNPKRDLVPFERTDLPVTGAGAAAIFLSDREPSLADRIAQLYPTAQEDTVTTPSGDHIGMYEFQLGPEDIQATEGVLAHYGVGDRRMDRREARLDFPWPASTPMPAPFPASFETTLSATTFGSYRFRLEGPGDATVTIDGARVVRGGQEAAIALAKGPHALRVDLSDAGLAPLRLLWAPPQQELGDVPIDVLHAPPVRVTGLLAKLYNGREPTSQPAIEEIDPSVDIRVNAIPLPRPYNVEWTGSILAPQDGTYRFGTNSIDSSTLWIDGQQVLTNTAPNAMVEGTIQLSAGWHDIRVGWLDATGFTHIQMSWTRPGGAPETVPSQALRPWPPAVIAEAQPSDADVAQAAALLSSQPIARGEAPQAPTSGTVLAGSTALSQPRGVTVTPDGTTYIADAGRRAIIEIPPDGGAPRALAQGQLKEPSAVAVLRDRTVLALDAGAGAIWRIDMDTGKLGDRFAPDQGFYGPRGIAVALDGRVAVADTGNNRIVIIPSTGSGAQVIGGLREPTDVAFLPDGSLLVAETGAKQITIVRSDGGRVSSWPMPEAYTVVGPHVAVLPRGGWVATAPEARTLLRMAPNGREPQQWGVDTGFKKPVGIAVSAQGIVVTDTDAGTATTYRAP